MKHLPVLFAILSLGLGLAQAEPMPLFKSGDNGYEMYRFPGLVRAKSGNLLAFSEGRKSTEMRWSETRPFIRVSTDGGATWSDAKQFADKPADAKQNAILLESGAAEADRIGVHNLVGTPDKDGSVHWVYCVEYSRAFYVKTDDKGEGATEPVEITATFDEFKSEVDWKLFATGPGHGIQHSASGRLIVPVWISDGTQGIGLQNAATATIYSDDAGKTWKRGEIVAKQIGLETKTGTEVEMPSEASIAEAVDGTVILNIRNKALKGQRAQATSKDGATGWSEATFVSGLMEPICQGSLTSAGKAIVFANPANMIMRKSLTAKVSEDGGKTYPKKFVIAETGASGYSDMASDGKDVFVIFEQGAQVTESEPEAVVFTKFGLSEAK